MRICPGFASSHSREATLDTVPIAIVKSALEADCAERGEAVRNIDAEANVVPEPTPPIGKFKFREAEAGRDLSARSRQLQLTFGTKYVAMEARYPLASARRNI